VTRLGHDGGMDVVDHEPSWWFLLQDGEQLYLDVNCEHSFIGYSMLIALDEQETRTLQREGRGYVDRLAEDINYGAPVLRDSTSPYKARDLSRTHGHLVSEAVRRWRSLSGG
jgi:hypothetical protein